MRWEARRSPWLGLSVYALRQKAKIAVLSVLPLKSVPFDPRGRDNLGPVST